MFHNTIFAEVGGVVEKIVAPVGSYVSAFDYILILKSINMDVSVASPSSGTVVKLLVKEGDVVGKGQAIAVLECPE